ncbi:TadE/TadG family type IV pilus assembly protein [Tessaracoccus sp. Y1736]
MTGRHRGSAAVEFALVLLPLCVLLLGIMDGGYYLYLRASAAGAAREGVRVMAIYNDRSAAEAAALNAFPGGSVDTPAEVVVPDSCKAGQPVAVTLRYSNGSISGFFPIPEIVESSVMRCGG